MDNIADSGTMKLDFGIASTTTDLKNDGITNLSDLGLLRGNFGKSVDSANWSAR